MVMFTRFAIAVTTFAAMFAAVAADLQILSPGGPDLWWVAKSQNVLAWACHSTTITNFTVLIGNSNPAILVQPMAIIGIEMNYQCSQEITQNQASQAAGTGYTILFADPFNSSHIYATSEPFEIKPLGSAYPAASSTPTESSANSTSTATATSAAASSSKSSSASSTKTSVGFGVAAIAAVLGLVTA